MLCMGFNFVNLTLPTRPLEIQNPTLPGTYRSLGPFYPARHAPRSWGSSQLHDVPLCGTQHYCAENDSHIRPA